MCTSSSLLTTPSEASRCRCSHPRAQPPLQHISAVRSCGYRLALFPGGPFVSGLLLAVLLGYEGDGTCPPRPPGSSFGPRSLRSGQVGLRFNVSLGGSGLAGGFQRAIMVDFVATSELFLTLAFLGKCLVG